MQGFTSIKFDAGKLRQARMSKGLSMVDAAERVGISKQRLWNYEQQDVRSTPDPDILARLCALYEVELSDLTIEVAAA